MNSFKLICVIMGIYLIIAGSVIFVKATNIINTYDNKHSVDSKPSLSISEIYH
jgi:hypothetical protein